MLREESAVDSRAGQYGTPLDHLLAAGNMQMRPAFPAEYRTGIISREPSPVHHIPARRIYRQLSHRGRYSS